MHLQSSNRVYLDFIENLGYIKRRYPKEEALKGFEAHIQLKLWRGYHDGSQHMRTRVRSVTFRLL
jgi:hypothetical protein